MTAQRLSEVYCLPKGAKEWDMFGLIDIGTNYAVWSVDGKATVTDCNLPELFTQIPVQHFIDLIEDKIVAWRLVEDGFEYASSRNDYYYLSNVLYKGIDVKVDAISNEVKLVKGINEIAFEGCKNYSDLITLIDLLK